MQRCRNLKPSRLRDGREGNLSQHKGQNVAAGHPDQDRCHFRDPFRKVIAEKYDAQRKKCDCPVKRASKVRRSRAACHVIHRRRIQGKTNRKDHSSRHNGWKQRVDLLIEDTDQDRNRAAHQLRAENGGQVKPASQRYQHGYVCKAGAHNDGKAGAAVFMDRKHLDQRSNRGYEQRRLDQDNLVLPAGACHSRDDDGRRHTAYDHGNHMLERQGQCLGHFGYSI